jgi:hypothetical protein
MRGMRRIVTAVGIGLLAGSSSLMGGEVVREAGEPGLRMLSVQLFWMDSADAAAEGGDGLSERMMAGDPGFLDYNRSGLRILTEEDPGAWDRGTGRALVAVPRLGGSRQHYALTSVRQDPVGRRQVRVDSVFGMRSRSRFGTVHTLSLSRVASLPEFARDKINEMVDSGSIERKVYWEAAFELTGLHRDEVKWVDALGPGLIKPPRKWVDVVRGVLEAPAVAGGIAIDPCLRLGPFGICMNMPKMIRSMAKGAYPKERSRVRLSRSLWHAGESCGVVVVGRLLEYSTLTFRVRTNGKGSRRTGVHYLPPFDMSTVQGWIRPEPASRSDDSEEELSQPSARKMITWEERYGGVARPVP